MIPRYGPVHPAPGYIPRPGWSIVVDAFRVRHLLTPSGACVTCGLPHEAARA